jgi:hypothetical protein
LLDRAARDESASIARGRNAYRGRIPAVAAGARRIFDVLEVPTRRGSAGVGIDATEVESIRAEHARMVDAHRRTLDQLATGVAIFGADQHARFYNPPIARCGTSMPLPGPEPTDSRVLDRLRAARKLAGEQDSGNGRASCTRPIARSRRVNSSGTCPTGGHCAWSPRQSEGGVTYLFDDVTERLDLERALRRLDPGTGRNARQSGRSGSPYSRATDACAAQSRLFAHVAARAGSAGGAPTYRGGHRPGARRCNPEDETLRALRSAVTGIGQREPVNGRLERRDGSVVDCTTVSLPTGRRS